MLTLALLGYGRMGREVERVAVDRGHAVSLRLASGQALDREALRRCDVAVDFSSPSAAGDLCRAALDAGVAVASGTTGWAVGELQSELRARDAPAFLHATNMSPGVNAVFAANRLLARVLGRAGGYRVEVEETHHVHKLDAPSGTAITLASGSVAGLPDYGGWVLREADDNSTEGSAGESRVPIQSIRRGEVIGDHHVTYDSAIDQITLRHHARSRQGFALGAVLAAEYIAGRRGVIGMDEALGLDS